MASRGSVLIIVENLPVPFDRRVWMEATTLRAAGYTVSVICPKGKGFDQEYEELEGVHIYRHPLPDELSSALGYVREYSSALHWELRLARQIARERPIDVVHICNPPDLLFTVALWLKVSSGARIIFDQHDLNPEMFEAKFGKRGPLYWAVRGAEMLTYRSADVVIATNESHRETAITRGRVPADRVFVVRSGPDLTRFLASPPDASYRRGKRFLVGYVGVMGEPEGIDLLIDAAEYVVRTRRRDDVHFALVGSGPAIERYRAYAAERGLEDCIEFTGRVPDAELLARISSCDLCVNPDPKTPYNDKCTMNKILEYMALEKPIVQFDVVEGRRSAADASLYAAPNDPIDFGEQIIRLLDDAPLRATMGHRGRQRMEEQLEWRFQAPRLLEAYERALAS